VVSANDPISPAEATGIEFHSVYQANINAGFSEAEALYILGCQITGNPGPAPGPPPSVMDHALLCAHGAVICARCDFIPPSWSPADWPR